MTGEAGPGRESHDHTPSPIRQMDQGSHNSEISSVESEKKKKLHGTNLNVVKQT
jgi:hypothetical protein